jgi:predicted phosphoribosyltransferase
MPSWGAKEWANREKALVAELRADPAVSQRLNRVVSVHRLRKLGMAFEDIAEELGISARHARRLIKRRLFIALRRHRTKVDRAAARRERELARHQARAGRRRGWRWRRRTD